MSFCVWLISLSIMFSSHPCCNRYQYFISFCGWIIFCHLYVLHFVYCIYLLVDTVLFPSWAIVENVTVDIGVASVWFSPCFQFFCVYTWKHKCWVIWLTAILTEYYAPKEKPLLKRGYLKVLKFLYQIFQTTQYLGH